MKVVSCFRELPQLLIIVLLLSCGDRSKQASRTHSRELTQYSNPKAGIGRSGYLNDSDLDILVREEIIRGAQGSVGVGYVVDPHPLPSAGGIISSSADLLQYGKLQLTAGSNPLEEEVRITHLTTFKNQSQNIGLAWQFLNLTDKIIFHTGQVSGSRSCIYVNLTKAIVLVMLSNQFGDFGKPLGLSLVERLSSLK